ncbi:unnamed protein product [Leptidea sinapis]|uniref:Uncharacterized protein n=1 Tax=Leptidea sinapis TaxID=189913 RepID=A0A5E4PV68_9NEOP|nr:unnamed protein product [Leptidea sinapis]
MKMKIVNVNVLIALFTILCLLACSEAVPVKSRNLDYLEAIRRMQQIPQWHCMRYRRFHPHGHCSRWWLTRRT